MQMRSSDHPCTPILQTHILNRYNLYEIDSNKDTLTNFGSVADEIVFIKRIIII